MIPAHVDVVAPGSSPTRVALLLHGILGSARNWRGFSRALVRRFPSWRLVLVDLRNHGDSHPAAPPHTLAACAADLDELAAHLGVAPELVIGHSFGGKVAMCWARTSPSGLREAWVLDTPPGAGVLDEDSDVGRVVLALRQVPLPIESADALVATLLGLGLSQALALWMTTNLERRGEAYVWRFDLDAVEAMLRDYGRTDLWSWLEGPPNLPVHVVRGGRSDRWLPSDVERLERIGETVSLTTLENAGHWLHVDDPSGLGALLGSALARLGDSP